MSTLQDGQSDVADFHWVISERERTSGACTVAFRQTEKMTFFFSFFRWRGNVFFFVLLSVVRESTYARSTNFLIKTGYIQAGTRESQ